MAARPVNYNLEFEPIFENFTFRGREEITAESPKPASRLTLHAADIKIQRCIIESEKGAHDAKVTIKPETEEMLIAMPHAASKFKVRIEFTGVLNDKLAGFYRSRYEAGGQTKYLATTQFEAADARRAFPCWDVPDAKATFEISLICEKSMDAISNMPRVSRKKIGGKILHKFAKTPVMSTYLVYLGVGEFEYSTKKANGVLVRTVTTKGSKKLGRYALNLAAELLSAYEDYFGIKYPLPKLDLIAVPDFAAGAMENWGAITFREALLLFNPKTSSTRTKRLIAEVISHEIAHQWFGNLVTMKWWNDLWLNESFATFMAAKFVDKLRPEWDVWDEFLEVTMNAAMMLDGLESTHPIDAKVSSPSQIQEIFDAISYDKGSCILMMLERYVGEECFQDGLKSYLKKFEYGNAEGGDLWDAIESSSNLPVRKMMESWIKKPGYPFLDAKGNGETALRQSRFRYGGSGRGPKWDIPIFAKGGPPILMTTSKMKIKQNILPINRERKGFYRVKYSEHYLKKFKKDITGGRMPYVARWAVQNDLFALCRAGLCSIGSYMDFAEAYRAEANYLPASDAARSLAFIYMTMYHDRQRFAEPMQAIRQHFEGLHSRLGWEPKRGESETVPLLRGTVILYLGMMGSEDVIRKSGSLFAKESMGSDIQEAVYSLAAWSGRVTPRQLQRKNNSAASSEESHRILRAMGMFAGKDAILQSLNYSIGSRVRSQDTHIAIGSASSNPYGRGVLWPWITEHWPKIQKKIGKGNPLLRRIVSSAVHSTEYSMADKVKGFFEKNPVPGTQQSLRQSMEWVKINHKFAERFREEYG